LQKSAIQDEQKRLDTDIASIQTEITALQSQKVELAQSAQNFLDQIKSQEILWSEVITKVQSLIPLDALTQTPKINVLSYSGSQDGSIMLNTTTAEAQIEPWESVAEMISAFNNSSFFTNAIVPGITRGETDQGKKILSFMISMTYNEEKPQDVSSSSTDANDVKPKVPRQ
jgi:hypothetical protein